MKINILINLGEMRLFKEGLLVYTFSMEKPISALRFGPYGREESSLICVHGQVLTFKLQHFLPSQLNIFIFYLCLLIILIHFCGTRGMMTIEL